LGWYSFLEREGGGGWLLWKGVYEYNLW
jgi:hypothetical protein